MALITLSQLLAVSRALLALTTEVEACQRELKRLRDEEMIAIQHQPNAQVGGVALAAAVVVHELITAAEKS
jgi:hypothetical protein